MLEREQTLESRSRLENLDEFMSVPKITKKIHL